jgi:hypothetical protein
MTAKHHSAILRDDTGRLEINDQFFLQGPAWAGILSDQNSQLTAVISKDSLKFLCLLAVSGEPLPDWTVGDMLNISPEKLTSLVNDANAQLLDIMEAGTQENPSSGRAGIRSALHQWSPTEIAQAHSIMAEHCALWHAAGHDMQGYAVRNYADHLYCAGRTAELLALATDAGFREDQVQVTGNRIHTCRLLRHALRTSSDIRYQRRLGVELIRLKNQSLRELELLMDGLTGNVSQRKQALEAISRKPAQTEEERYSLVLLYWYCLLDVVLNPSAHSVIRHTVANGLLQGLLRLMDADPRTLQAITRIPLLSRFYLCYLMAGQGIHFRQAFPQGSVPDLRPLLKEDIMIDRFRSPAGRRVIYAMSAAITDQDMQDEVRRTLISRRILDPWMLSKGLYDESNVEHQFVGDAYVTDVIDSLTGELNDAELAMPSPRYAKLKGDDAAPEAIQYCLQGIDVAYDGVISPEVLKNWVWDRIVEPARVTDEDEAVSLTLEARFGMRDQDREIASMAKWFIEMGDLTRAERLSKLISDDFQEGLVLEAIALSHTRQGHPEEASRVVESIGNPIALLSAIPNVAAELFTSSFHEYSRSMLRHAIGLASRMLDDEEFQLPPELVLASLFEPIIQVGLEDDAVRLMITYTSDPALQERLWTQVATSAISQGNIVRACWVADRMPPSLNRIRTMTWIILAAHNDAGEVRLYIEPLREGMINEIMDSEDLTTKEQVLILLELAFLFDAHGQPVMTSSALTNARTCLTQLDTPWERILLEPDYCAALVQCGRSEEALERARRLRSDSLLQFEALSKMAHGSFHKGNHDLARNCAELAYAALESHDHGSITHDLFLRLVYLRCLIEERDVAHRLLVHLAETWDPILPRRNRLQIKTFGYILALPDNQPAIPAALAALPNAGIRDLLLASLVEELTGHSNRHLELGFEPQKILFPNDGGDEESLLARDLLEANVVLAQSLVAALQDDTMRRKALREVADAWLKLENTIRLLITVNISGGSNLPCVELLELVEKAGQNDLAGKPVEYIGAILSDDLIEEIRHVYVKGLISAMPPIKATDDLISILFPWACKDLGDFEIMLRLHTMHNLFIEDAVNEEERLYAIELGLQNLLVRYLDLMGSH